jgi:hypothetical protein
MTTIIAVEGVDGVAFCGDVLTQSGAGRRFEGPGMEKVVRRAEFLLAASGNGPRPDAVTQFLPPPPPDTRMPHRYIREEFVPALRRHFESHGLPDLGTDDGLEVLVGWQGKAYQLDGDGVLLMDWSGFYAIGSGAAYALGALAQGADILRAMNVAHQFDPNTGSPGQTIRQKRPGL